MRDDARRQGVSVHLGRICELCYEKGSELAADDESGDRIFKGRDVFLGDNVKDEYFDYAVFEELGSAPPSMEAARCIDALSTFARYVETQADAVSAYTQSFLKGIKTWVHLPKERWPDWWHTLPYHDPVVPLYLALYGHPDAGGYWEEQCESAVKECGWIAFEEWQSVFWHPEHKALLVIYVDDFKWRLLNPNRRCCGRP